MKILAPHNKLLKSDFSFLFCFKDYCAQKGFHVNRKN